MLPDDDDVAADVVAHRNALRQNSEDIAAADAKWRAGQQRQAKRRNAANARLLGNNQPIPVIPASATLMAERAERRHSIAAELARQDKARATARWHAIKAAKDPPERDPRTTAEILAGEVEHKSGAS